MLTRVLMRPSGGTAYPKHLPPLGHRIEIPTEPAIPAETGTSGASICNDHPFRPANAQYPSYPGFELFPSTISSRSRMRSAWLRPGWLVHCTRTALLTMIETHRHCMQNIIGPQSRLAEILAIREGPKQGNAKLCSYCQAFE